MKLGFMCSQFMDLETKYNKNCFFLNANCFGSKWVSSYQTSTSRSVSKASVQASKMQRFAKTVNNSLKDVNFFRKTLQLTCLTGY